MRVGITGASGLIGSALAARLRERGDVPVPFVRRTPQPGEIGWDPAAGRLAPDDVAGLDAIVNLAGAGIGDRRWTAEYRRELVESRTASTRLVAERMAEVAADGGPRVLVSASAVGYYGDRGDEPLDESSRPGGGFLSDICVAWEAATEPAVDAGVRVAVLRTGIVLDGERGALPKMLPLFKLGVGGPFGSGRQWFSWIALADEISAIELLLDRDVRGPVNAVAPNPVTNKQFARTLGAVLRRPAWLPAPAFAPRLLLGRDRANALLFDGQRVVPRALTDAGFAFRFPELDAALRAVLGR